MLYLTLKRTQCLRSFKVNATAFSTLIDREKTGKSKKHKQFLLKNLRIEYFNSIISKTSLTKIFYFLKYDDARHIFALASG